MPSDLTHLLQDLLDRVAAAEPVLATQLGMAAHAGAMPDYSAPALRTYVDAIKPLLTDLDRLAADPAAAPADAIEASTGAQIARRVVRTYETRRVQRDQPTLYLDATYGVLLLMIKDVVPAGERVEALAGRLRAVPGLLEEAEANLADELPAPYVRSALDDVPGVRELVGETAPAFAAALGAPGALDEPGRLAAGAVERFGALLRDHYLPRAVPDVAAGRDLLVEILEQEYLLEETPEQIAAYGRRMVDETRAAMAERAAAMGFADVEAAVAAVQAEHPALADLLPSYRDALAAARSFVVDHDLVTFAPGERLVVEETPPPLRASLPFAAYEGPGPYEERQQGHYWVTLPTPDLSPERLERALSDHPFASMRPVGVHEAYPGHHVQISRANRAPTLARRIAHIPDGGTLLVEGWAFYCEEMMEAQGFLADPGVRLMRLNDQVWRACRVVIDMELNLGRMG
ncbi:MAG TPA: DUF885 family protein, partial [Thermoleophilia bacterium]|nr:DUF885 family protein [Thermoleophilia bacterium]